MDFNIILRDNEGRAFSSTGNFEFSYDLDVINVINVSPGKTNESIQVEALRPGEAILRVFTNSKSIPLDDYVKVTFCSPLPRPSPAVCVQLTSASCYCTFFSSTWAMASPLPSRWFTRAAASIST
jgi:hypothetical protein